MTDKMIGIGMHSMIAYAGACSSAAYRAAVTFYNVIMFTMLHKNRMEVVHFNVYKRRV